MGYLSPTEDTEDHMQLPIGAISGITWIKPQTELILLSKSSSFTLQPPTMAARLDQFDPAVTKPKFGFLTKKKEKDNLKTHTTGWLDDLHNCDNLQKTRTISSEKQLPHVAIEKRQKSDSG